MMLNKPQAGIGLGGMQRHHEQGQGGMRIVDNQGLAVIGTNHIKVGTGLGGAPKQVRRDFFHPDLVREQSVLRKAGAVELNLRHFVETVVQVAHAGRRVRDHRAM